MICTARTGSKRQTNWYGYKVHVTETCDDDTSHLITHVKTAHAIEPDVTQIDHIHQALAQHNRLSGEHIVDADYVTSTHLVTSQDEYGIELLEPTRPDVSWQA